MSEHVPSGRPESWKTTSSNECSRRRLFGARGEVFEAADVAQAFTVLKKIAVDILISDVSLIDGTALARRP